MKEEVILYWGLERSWAGSVYSIIIRIPGKVLFRAPVVALAEVDSRKRLLSSDWLKSLRYQKVTPLPAKCEMQCWVTKSYARQGSITEITEFKKMMDATMT